MTVFPYSSAFPRMFSDGPIFTVVIPVYNRASLVIAAVRSVLAQTFQSFEVVVVDDGSTDDARSAILAIQDPRIRFFRQENRGASAARNKGIDEAIGKYIAFLDSDDLFLPDHLETMAALLESSDATIAYAPVLVIRDSTSAFVKPPRGIRQNENMATYLVCDRGFVQTSGLVLPADIAKGVRYREDVSFGDDTDFAIRLQLSGHSFVMSNHPTVVWTDDADRERLSTGRKPLGDLDWLEDIRDHIPAKVYHGYRGWHLAKSIAEKRPGKATFLFLRALFHRAYPIELAAVIFLQIFLRDRHYRAMTNGWLRISKNWRGDLETT